MDLASSQPRAKAQGSLLLTESEGSNSTTQGGAPIQPPQLCSTHSEVAMSLFSLWENEGWGAQYQSGFAPWCPKSSHVGIPCLYSESLLVASQTGVDPHLLRKGAPHSS